MAICPGVYLTCGCLMLAGLRNKRRKKAGRLNTHIMDDYVEMDDSQDGAETPVAMRMGAGRRPTAMLRPLSGTSDRQCASLCKISAALWDGAALFGLYWRCLAI